MDQLLSLDLALALQSQRDTYFHPDDEGDELDEEGRGGGFEGGDFDYGLSGPDNISGRRDKSARDKSARDNKSISSVHSGFNSGNSTPNVTARAALMHAAVVQDERSSPGVDDDASPRAPVVSSPTPRVKRLAYNSITHPLAFNSRDGNRNGIHRPSLFMPDIGGVGNLVMTARGNNTHNTHAQSTRGENITNMGASFSSNPRGSAGSRGSMNSGPNNKMNSISEKEKNSIHPLHILIVDDRWVLLPPSDILLISNLLLSLLSNTSSSSFPL